MRDTPIAIPIGMAVTQAATEAEKTRKLDPPKCSASGASVSSPSVDSYSRVNTVSGVGRNSGGTQRKWLASHHSARSAIMVATLIAVVEPSPSVANFDVFASARAAGLASFMQASPLAHRRARAAGSPRAPLRVRG